MFVDYVLNRQAHGAVAGAMQGCHWDSGMMRPYFDERGIPSVTVNTGRTKWDDKLKRDVPIYEKYSIAEMMARGANSPVFNATSLRKNEWELFDSVPLRVARKRLRAYADLAASNTYGGFNGMSKMILEHETMSDPGEALVDMDALSEGTTDAADYQLEGLPLPIIHSGFRFSSRRLAVSRNTGTPLDTTGLEAATRRVLETVEKLTIGTLTGLTYGNASNYGRTPSVYGYTNFTNRITYTSVTTPTGSNPEATVANVLAMRDLAYAKNHFGPFMLYHSNDWDRYLDNDYARLGGSNANMTLRDRLRRIDEIQDVRRLDFLTNTFTLLLVEMQPETARAVEGMPITTLQWESKGGLQINFKVMCIMVPQLRADRDGNCGIVHGTTA